MSRGPHGCAALIGPRLDEIFQGVFSFQLQHELLRKVPMYELSHHTVPYRRIIARKFMRASLNTCISGDSTLCRTMAEVGQARSCHRYTGAQQPGRARTTAVRSPRE